MMRSAVLSLFLVSAALPAADKPAVVELFEDDTEALIPQLTNNGEADWADQKAEADKTDVFAGKVSLRVGKHQRYCPDLKGWEFPVVEKPGPGEFRFVRFAWRKTENASVMIQFCGKEGDWEQRWAHRYFAGPNTPDWNAKQLSPDAPRDWVVVTRDLFLDFGAFTLGGIAFSPMAWGGEALFDHIVLGRTLEDLDRHTLTALKNTPRPVKLTAARLDEHWKNLGHWEDTNAIWQLTAHREQIAGLAEQKLAAWKPMAHPPADAGKAKQLIEAAANHQFLVREQAAGELFKLGDGVLPLVREAIDRADGERKARLQAVMRKWTGNAVHDRLRFDRCRRALAAEDTPEAIALLARVNALLGDIPEKKP